MLNDVQQSFVCVRAFVCVCVYSCDDEYKDAFLFNRKKHTDFYMSTSCPTRFVKAAAGFRKDASGALQSAYVASRSPSSPNSLLRRQATSCASA